MVTNLHLRRAVHGYRDLLQQLLREAHHPVVVLVLHIQLHARELGVVAPVHAFVAEVTADLIYTLKSSYYQSLQVQLSRYTQVHIHIQRVMMRYERTSTRATGYSLQYRCLHLRISRLVKHLTHRPEDRRTLQEGVLHPLVHHQIDIPLTIPLLRIIEPVISHAVLVLNDRQRTNTLRQHGQLLRVHAYLAHLCPEHESLNPDKVTYIQ